MRPWLLGASLLAATAAARSGSWTDLPALPVAISGQFAGVSHGALIVVGGSSFEKPPYDGGVKQWHDRILVLAPGSSQWHSFPREGPIGYGGSVTWRDSLVMAGGSNGAAHTRNVRRIEWRDGKPVITALPGLPEATANCEAALIGDMMYVFGGQDAPASTKASSSLVRLDLAHPERGWRTLPPLPGPGRILPVFAAVGSQLFVFGGAELTPRGRHYLQDGWRWSEAGGWRSTVPPSHPMVAAPAVAIDPGSVLVFGGDDGANATRVEELRERHPGFHTEVYEFSAAQQKWTRRAALPLGLVTTTAVVWQGRIVIPGGEDRPGHRSARVLGWNPR